MLWRLSKFMQLEIDYLSCMIKLSLGRKTDAQQRLGSISSGIVRKLHRHLEVE